MILCPICKYSMMSWTKVQRNKQESACMLWCVDCGYVEVLWYLPFRIVEYTCKLRLTGERDDNE